MGACVSACGHFVQVKECRLPKKAEALTGRERRVEGVRQIERGRGRERDRERESKVEGDRGTERGERVRERGLEGRERPREGRWRGTERGGEGDGGEKCIYFTQKYVH